MTAAPRRWAAELLYVWFHVLKPADWFGGSDQVDELLRRRFAGEWDALRHRPAQEFMDGPCMALAAILLFDQVPRNIHRDDPAAFATDPLARQLARRGIASGWHRALTRQQRQFFGMPLMHSERIADQRAALHYFVRYAPEAFPFARSHHTMIARFGRFPHRNRMLGRDTTPDERRAIEAGFAW